MAQSGMPRSRGQTRHIKSARTHLPGDPPQVQVHIAWDDASMLAILATADGRFRKRATTRDPTG